MYVAVKDTGTCEVAAALPRNAFLATTVATSVGELRVHLCESGVPAADKPKRLHADLPDPLCFQLLWGSVYYGLVDGAGAAVPLDRDTFAAALASMAPAPAPPSTLASFAELEDDCVAAADAPEDSEGSDDGSDDGSECEECEDAMAVCEACNGEGCSNCADGEADESEVEGEL